MACPTSLLVYATPATAIIEHSAFLAALTSAGFIDKPLDGNYLAGARFFEYINFIGCAPNIALRPAQSDDYLRIAIPELASPSLMTAPKIRPLRCLHCNASLDDWVKHIVWLTPPQISCQQCAKASSLESYHLHKRACFSRTIIQISPVFEGEALPTDVFLEALEGQFNTAFKIAFV